MREERLHIRLSVKEHIHMEREDPTIWKRGDHTGDALLKPRFLKLANRGDPWLHGRPHRRLADHRLHVLVKPGALLPITPGLFAMREITLRILQIFQILVD